MKIELNVETNMTTIKRDGVERIDYETIITYPSGAKQLVAYMENVLIDDELPCESHEEVGTCNDCTKCSKNDKNETAYNLCLEHGIGVRMSFFCADFERKED